jgi:hypothetical protein
LSFSITPDPSVRYTLWSLLIGITFLDIGMLACTQTQAQRYMCVKDTKAAQRYFGIKFTNCQFCSHRVAWINYAMTVVMQILWACVGCLIYAKYSQCDPLKAELILRSDQVGWSMHRALNIRCLFFFTQLYPLFVIQTLGRFPGFTGLFIACILSASLSTISSGVNSMATVIVEDIYKRISIARPMSNERQATVSKLLCKCHFSVLSQLCYLWIKAVGIGLLTIFLAFIVSYMKSNILTVSFVL